jgi:hypothetical protein
MTSTSLSRNRKRLNTVEFEIAGLPPRFDVANGAGLEAFKQKLDNGRRHYEPIDDQWDIQFYFEKVSSYHETLMDRKKARKPEVWACS